MTLIFFQKLKRFIKRIIQKDNSPHSISLGLAIGVFIGFMPIFGFQMIPAVALSLYLRANKLAAAAGVWITNPLTFIPIYLFNYWIGSLVIMHKYSEDSATFKDFLLTMEFSWQAVFELSYSTLLPLLLGCFINGVVGSILIYFVSKFLIIRWRQRHFFIKNKVVSKVK